MRCHWSYSKLNIPLSPSSPFDCQPGGSPGLYHVVGAACTSPSTSSAMPSPTCTATSAMPTCPRPGTTPAWSSRFPRFKAEWSRKIAPLLAAMGNVEARHNYQHLLTPSQKSTLATLLDKLVTKLNASAEELKGCSEFQWAKQSAISVRLLTFFTAMSFLLHCLSPCSFFSMRRHIADAIGRKLLSQL